MDALGLALAPATSAVRHVNRAAGAVAARGSGGSCDGDGCTWNGSGQGNLQQLAAVQLPSGCEVHGAPASQVFHCCYLYKGGALWCRNLDREKLFCGTCVFAGIHAVLLRLLARGA